MTTFELDKNGILEYQKIEILIYLLTLRLKLSLEKVQRAIKI